MIQLLLFTFFVAGLIAGLCFGIVIGARSVDKFWRSLTRQELNERRGETGGRNWSYR